jgi:hypothetical protein
MKYRTKTWNALIDFHDYLVRTKAEKVKDFNGHTLVTDKGEYGLVAGVLSFKERLVKKRAPRRAKGTS